jgi:large subunit ribosomal protein L22
MEVRATAKYVRVQPRKVRIVADEVRGKDALYAASLLRYHRSKGAFHLHKVLVSAIANAEANNGLQPESLRIATIMVDEGPRLKRMQARAMGRGNRIIKKTSHITVVVEDFDQTPVASVQTTKAKARPSFGNAPRKKAAGVPTVNVPVASTSPVAETVEPETAEVENVEAPAETPETVQEATPVEASEAPEQEGAESAPTQAASSEEKKEAE